MFSAAGLFEYLDTHCSHQDILTFYVSRRPDSSCRDELFSLKSLCVFAFTIVVLQHELIIVTVCITSVLNHQPGLIVGADMLFPMQII